MALVLAAAAERAVPGLPQGPRHSSAVSAGCSGDINRCGALRIGADPDVTVLVPWDSGYPWSRSGGLQQGLSHQQQEAKGVTRVSSAWVMALPGWGGTYHTCPRRCRVQSGAGAGWCPQSIRSPRPVPDTALGPVGPAAHPGRLQVAHRLPHMPDKWSCWGTGRL